MWKSRWRVWIGLLIILVVYLPFLWPGGGYSTSEIVARWAPDAAWDEPLLGGELGPGLDTAVQGRFYLGPAAPSFPQPAADVERITPDVVPAGRPDVRANAVDSPPQPETVQSETSIALNGNTGTICVTYNDTYHHYQGTGICGFSRSTDGGDTWRDGGSMPVGQGNKICRGDPSVAWRAADGYFYFAALDYGSSASGASIWRSTDDCASFQWLATVARSGYEDKELLTIDNYPTSPYYGRFYVAWLRLDNNLHYSTYSTNGTTWSSPLNIGDPTERPAGDFPIAAPNGDLYIGWAGWYSFPFSNVDQDMLRSTDGGLSFSWVTPPAENIVPPHDPTADDYCNFIAIRGFLRYLPSLQIAITPGATPDDYCLHVVYPRDPDAYGVGDAANVYYRRSCDYGATWSPEVMLNDDGGLTDQFYPSLTANEKGVVVATWYDRRNDPDFNYYFERWGTVSYDNGATWEPNRQIGDVASSANIGPLSFCNHGDYDLMASDQDYAYTVWADDRVYYNGHYDQDIWFDKLPLWPDFDLQADETAFAVCRPGTVTTTLDVGSIFFYNQPVLLSDSGVPAGVNTSFSVNPVTPEGASIYTIQVTAGATDGAYAWRVQGTSPTATHGLSITLDVAGALPSPTNLISPPDGAPNMPLGHILFQWGELAAVGGYHLQVDDDPAFGSPEADVSEIAGNSYDLPGQLLPSTTYYWRVAAANACGESAFTPPRSFTTAAPCLLLVDDDNNDPDMASYFQDALNLRGYSYDVFDVGGGTGNGPTLAELENYALVIWFSGDKVGGGAGPSATDETNLTAYLDGGGRLFLSSQDYLHDRGLTSFANTYLGVTSFTDDGADPRVMVGQAGDPIGANTTYMPAYPPDFMERGDVVNPTYGTLVAFRSLNGSSLALDRNGGAWRTVFFANDWVPLHFLEADREAAVLGRIVEWLGGCPTTAPAIVVDPTALEMTLEPNQTQTQTLWIRNVGDANLSWAVSELSRTLALSRPRAEPVIDAAVWGELQGQEQVRVLIYLRELADLSPAYGIPNWEGRGYLVYDRLVETAARSGGALLTRLEEAGAAPRQLLAANAIAATVDGALLNEVAARPEVARIGPNSPVVSPLSAEEQLAAIDVVEWNISRIGADLVWSTFGISGTGVTVGVVDTGVQYTHPALARQYRGNLGGGNYDHNYNWFDFVNGQTVPYDDNGHGTNVAGVLVGDDGAGNQIGVAPGAKWIAVKPLTSSGGGTLEDVHAAMDWMLAPTDLGGGNPNPSMRPQVGINLWGLTQACSTEFQPDAQAWRAANILPIWLGGQSGPNCGTTISPTDMPEAFGAGATDASDVIASWSSRGPSCYGEIKPEVTAPGVNIRTSTTGSGYASRSGSSYSSAHLAGTAALVLSADPALDVSQVETIITSTAVCVQDLGCGGTACPAGRNNTYGWGRLDAFAAVSLTLGGPPEPFDLPWLSENPLQGTVQPGGATAVAVTFDATGLTPGVYQGRLDVQSNDPANPHVYVPVTLTVAQCDPVTGTSFAWQPPTPQAGDVVTFTASASGTMPIAYSWDLGDGTSASGPVVVHAYATAGDYVVILTATNTCGQQVVAQTITIWPASCTPVSDAAFTWTPVTPTVGEVVVFTGTATGTLPIMYDWQLDVGSWETGPVVMHTYDLPGVYQVILTATNGCGTEVVSHTVTVLPAACAPVEIVTVTTNIAGCVVSFGAELDGAAPFAWLWDFGAFGNRTEPTPTMDFSQDGVYPYTLTVQNCTGAYSDTYAGAVTVACGVCEPVSSAEFDWTPFTPTAGQVVTFTGAASGSLPITYTWSFGDGSVVNGLSPVVFHTYTLAGLYTVTLTTTNCLTATATVQHALQVLAAPVEYFYVYLPLVSKSP